LTGPEPRFLAGVAGPLFALHFAAQRKGRRGVLVLPPFAEELNKSRRMLSLAARALQRVGLHVLLVDLYGTGDSGGDFADATLSLWRDDLQRAAAWLSEQGVVGLDVLAVRGGTLLVQDLALPTGMARGSVVLWQPVLSGASLVAQFLRLRVAEAMTSEPDAKAPGARSLLEDTGRIEVAGYEITRELVAELESIGDPLARPDGWQEWSWFELAGPGVSGPSAATQRAIARLRERGLRVREAVIEGEPFWATPETAVVPALIDATVAALAERGVA
jgi:exosortase A-associated hydrolase 2